MRINVVISNLPENATEKDIVNAVRRNLKGEQAFEPNKSVKVGQVRVVTKGGKVSDVRKWARENGHAVGKRGKVRAEIQAAYEAAHAKKGKKARA